MLEEIIREIEEMEYPFLEIGCGLEDEEITDRYAAAAYGFGAAQERIVEIIRSHGNDGWIPCSKRMPEEPEDGLEDMRDLEDYIVMIHGAEEPASLKYAGDGEWYDPETSIFYQVDAWMPYPSPYRPVQKSVGEDYKQQIMERFLKVE